MIDGRHAGYLENKICDDFMSQMKSHKIDGNKIPKET
jgi:hypothetical protein